MKIKRAEKTFSLKIIVAIFLIFSNYTIAQEGINDYTNENKCKEKLSIYYEYFKSGNYNDSYNAWKYCFDNCPKSHINVYIHGPKLVEFKLKNAKTKEEKEKYKELLVSVFDNRLKNFPDKRGYVLGLKGSNMMKHKIGDLEEVFNILNESCELEKDESSGSTLYNYFLCSVKLFNNKVFSTEKIFDIYSYTSECLQGSKEKLDKIKDELSSKEKLSAKDKKLLRKTKSNLKIINAVKININKVIAPLASCEKLEKFYSNNIKTNKKEEWIKSAIKMLMTKKCTDTPIFLDLIKLSYELNPTPGIARIIGNKYFSMKDYKNAIKYYEISANEEDDNKKKADNYISIAKSYMSQKDKHTAREFIYKAIESKKDYGKPYMILGNLYANSANECGANEFEKRCVYWLAISTFNKAASVDPSMANEAKKMAKTYMKLAPDKTLIFKFGHSNGDRIKIKCWINKEVIVSQ
ncbi:tetratricopeptide repeat protein [Ichthyobacterium seriolicida]|uniref:Uncharacterized protein n=1 Tax=Ichthyobacterium seriolicida TaxID=242600 RepID=A0A1J1E318_9FLAO|nr:hypothetical protein [Ichthyobacterium seriolicida]BAV95357.1 hypothetical protein JBKA6_1344 [Ichthyobacterium seriolicida]